MAFFRVWLNPKKIIFIDNRPKWIAILTFCKDKLFLRCTMKAMHEVEKTAIVNALQ